MFIIISSFIQKEKNQSVMQVSLAGILYSLSSGSINHPK